MVRLFFQLDMKINKRKASIIVIVFILLLFLGSAFLAYGSGSSIGLVSRIKGVYPAVIVGSKGISVREYEETIAAAKSLPNFNKKQAYEQMIKHRKTEVFLERKNLGLSPEDLAKETKFLTSDKAEYQKLLQSNFHNDSNLFRNSVVYPLTLEAKAKIYYSSQNSLHNDEYKEANDTLEKVKTDAASFNDLAQQVSDDKFSAQFGGDLGFFQEGQGKISLAHSFDFKKNFIQFFKWQMLNNFRRQDKVKTFIWDGQSVRGGKIIRINFFVNIQSFYQKAEFFEQVVDNLVAGTDF